MGSSYQQKLRDPKWQRKRLEVFNRAKWTCERCGRHTKEMHVHHGYYDGRDPWDYELESLFALCTDCHHRAHQFIAIIHRHLAFLGIKAMEVIGESVMKGSTLSAACELGELTPAPEELDIAPLRPKIDDDISIADVNALIQQSRQAQGLLPDGSAPEDAVNIADDVKVYGKSFELD